MTFNFNHIKFLAVSEKFTSKAFLCLLTSLNCGSHLELGQLQESGMFHGAYVSTNIPTSAPWYLGNIFTEITYSFTFEGCHATGRLHEVLLCEKVTRLLLQFAVEPMPLISFGKTVLV